VIGNLVMNSISQNFLPTLTKVVAKGDYKSFYEYLFKYITSFSIILGLLIVILSYVFGEFFLTLVYGEKYAEYSDVLILMSFAMAISFVSWGFDLALMSMRY